VALVFVPTPIGNRGDITLRALETLRDCDLLVAEDTRVARRLFALYDLPWKPAISYREQNAKAVTPAILTRATSGLVAVVSDAGTPALSDPGRELVVAARAAGIEVRALPGAAAFICAAVLSGFPLDDLRFGGFLPRSEGKRRDALRDALRSGATHVWYEAPHRMLATLATFESVAPHALVFVARELTKAYEQHAFGTPAAVCAALGPVMRGEFALVLGPSQPPAAASPDVATILAAIDEALATGSSVPSVARELARELGVERARVYALAAERKRRLR